MHLEMLNQEAGGAPAEKPRGPQISMIARPIDKYEEKFKVGGIFCRKTAELGTP